MLTNKLPNMFSNTHGNSASSLLDGMKKVLVGINSCITTTENINNFKFNSDIQNGLNRLTLMQTNIEKKIELTSGITFRR